MFEFADLNSKLSLILLQPKMLTVLGSTLFFKHFLPIISSSSYNLYYIIGQLLETMFIKRFTKKNYFVMLINFFRTTEKIYRHQ